MDSSPPDATWWFLHELSSRVVAESGIPSDRYHLGKIILQSFKDAPDFIMQIDGATDHRETFKSAMDRSIRCAAAFRNLGLQHQDVIILMAPNHLDLTIPMYAALYLGVAVAGIDMHLGVSELCNYLKSLMPKIIFCENFNVGVVREAIKSLSISPLIVTFGEEVNFNDVLSFKDLIEKKWGDTTADNFRASELDPEKTIGLLTSTSGSTGLPKAAILTHKNIYIGFPSILVDGSKYPTPYNMTIVTAPIQWISATFQYIMSPILRFTRTQSSLPSTPDHVYFLINKYRPEFTVTGATFLTSLLKPGERDKCDFTSFKSILVGGSAVTKKLLREVKKVAPNINIKIGYGMTETSGMVTDPTYSPEGSLGVPSKRFQFRIQDPATNETISKANITGELLLKGPSVTTGYYNDPEVTASAFDNGWFKTGDLVYRDENFNLYFVDRLKLVLKYKSHQVSPVEVESVIITHPGVLDVAVTGLPDEECGDLPVAFVVPHEGCNISEQEIQDLVKGSLTDSKQLRGGVIFLKELPTTATSKIDRPKLKEMAARLKK